MNDKIKILIVEDEDSIREFIGLNLKMSGFDTIEASSGEEALSIYKECKADVILLDILLPGIDGFQVCQKIREDSPKAAIIMLTARGQDMDKIMGLEMGADDYIIKPFNPLELIARIRALLRRVKTTGHEDNSVLHSGPFTVETNAQKLFKKGLCIDLTPREYSLAVALMNNMNKALSRDELLNLAWGNDFFGDPKTLDVHIRRLRGKIEDNPSDPKYIETIWGYGYMWREDSIS